MMIDPIIIKVQTKNPARACVEYIGCVGRNDLTDSGGDLYFQSSECSTGEPLRIRFFRRSAGGFGAIGHIAYADIGSWKEAISKMEAMPAPEPRIPGPETYYDIHEGRARKRMFDVGGKLVSEEFGEKIIEDSK